MEWTCLEYKTYQTIRQSVPHCGLLNGTSVDTGAHLQSAKFRRPVRDFWMVPICSDPFFILSERKNATGKYGLNMPKKQLAKFIWWFSFWYEPTSFSGVSGWSESGVPETKCKTTRCFKQRTHKMFSKCEESQDKTKNIRGTTENGALLWTWIQ